MLPTQEKLLPDLVRLVRFMGHLAASMEMPFIVDGRPLSSQTVSEATGLLPAILHAAGRVSQAVCGRRDLFVIASDASALTGYRVEEAPYPPVAFTAAMVLDVFKASELNGNIDLTRVFQNWMEADKAEYMPQLAPHAA